MSNNYEITKSDIPLAMQVLEIKTKEVFAEALGITPRSLGDGTLAQWRQMSIECLLRREGKWELFCQLRGQAATASEAGNENQSKEGGPVAYRCIICDRCLGTLHEIPTLPISKATKEGK